MQRSPSWLAALANAVGRVVGLATGRDEEPILPYYGPPSPSAEPVTVTVTGAKEGHHLPADRFLSIVEDGKAVPAVWIKVGRPVATIPSY
jgi:hypothetical protein